MFSCSLAERQGWFGGRHERLAEASRFGTEQLAILSQDDSRDLRAVADILAGIADCEAEDIAQQIREQVSQTLWCI